MAKRKWLKASFEINADTGVLCRDGYEYAGLGMFEESLSAWSLTHLNTGLRICYLLGEWSKVRLPATKIAELGDWTFRGTSKCPKSLRTKALGFINSCPIANRANSSRRTKLEIKNARQIAEARP